MPNVYNIASLVSYSASQAMGFADEAIHLMPRAHASQSPFHSILSIRRLFRVCTWVDPSYHSRRF